MMAKAWCGFEGTHCLWSWGFGGFKEDWHKPISSSQAAGCPWAHTWVSVQQCASAFVGMVFSALGFLCVSTSSVSMDVCVPVSDVYLCAVFLCPL